MGYLVSKLLLRWGNSREGLLRNGWFLYIKKVCFIYEGITVLICQNLNFTFMIIE